MTGGYSQERSSVFMKARGSLSTRPFENREAVVVETVGRPAAQRVAPLPARQRERARLPAGADGHRDRYLSAAQERAHVLARVERLVVTGERRRPPRPQREQALVQPELAAF